MYHKVILNHQQEPTTYEGAKGPNQWTTDRYQNLLRLKQNALVEARRQWADYIFVSFVLLLTQPSGRMTSERCSMDFKTT